MKVKIYLRYIRPLIIFFLLISSYVSVPAQTQYFSSDKAFILTYPADWKVNKFEQSGELAINAPDGSLFKPCMIKIEIAPLESGYEDFNIHELSEVLLKIMKSQTDPSLNFEILKSSFEKIKDKEWWFVNAKISKKKAVYFSNSYKAIHRSKAYTVTYFSTEKNFEKNAAAAYKIFETIEFLTKDDSKGAASKSALPNKNETNLPEKKTVADKKNNDNSGKTSIAKKAGEPVKVSEPIAAAEAPALTEEEEKAKAARHEDSLIKSCAGGLVKRRSKSLLEIKLGNGKSLPLKNEHDKAPMDEQLLAYNFDGCIDEMNMYKFGIGGWEWSSYLLVNKEDGKKYTLYNEPVLSPDKKKLVTFIIADGFSSDSSFIKVMAYKSNQLVDEYKFTPKTWGPQDVKWTDDNTIFIETAKYDEAASEMKKLKPKTLSFLNNKWILK